MFKNRKLTRISLLVLGFLLVLGSAMYVVPRVLASTCFTDVSATDWFEPYVCWLKSKGITSGYPLHAERLPANVYVADASLFPASLGNPPIWTIMALAKRVAKICRHGFGMRVLGNQRRLRQMGPDAEPATLEEILKASDFIVITCPLTPETIICSTASGLRR